MPEATVEPVEDFRSRLRTWLADNMPRAARPGDAMAMSQGRQTDDEELAEVAHHRDLQGRLFDAGFAGICFPTEYGGQGLTPGAPASPQRGDLALRVPVALPGSDAAAVRDPAPRLRNRGAEGASTSPPSSAATRSGCSSCPSRREDPTSPARRPPRSRDGDEWVLNGSKIWTTGAWWADWGLILARTNWDVPKHRGLTVFILPLHQPSIEVHRIEMLNGSREFCQEFLTDVRVPDTDRDR